MKKISAKKLKVFIFLLLLFSKESAATQCVGLVTAGVGKFWDDVIAGAEKASQELNIALYARGPVDESNMLAQRHILQHVVNTAKCRGLVLAPMSKALLPQLELFSQKGIPTVYIDRDIGGSRVSVIRSNNALAGTLAAKAMLKALNGQGSIAIFGLKKSVVTTGIREAAFITEVTKSGFDIKVNYSLGTTIGTARAKAFILLEKEEDIDAIFTSSYVSTVSVVKALKELKKSKKIVHIGFDADKLFVNALRKNTLHGIVIQDPFQMGYKAIHTVYKAMKGEQVSEYITTNSMYVNKENMNHIDIKKMLKINKKKTKHGIK